MTYIVGIDVGGTHADGVLLSNGQVLVKDKVQVDQQDLSSSIVSLLKNLIPKPLPDLERIQLSTTLCTNAIVAGKLDQVGMFIQSGPGMNPSFLQCGEHVCLLDGAIDHRGHVIKNPDEGRILAAARKFQKNGIQSVGIVTKFSQRNPQHEQQLQNLLAEFFPHISTGHRISGLPNFPRRVYSTWLNGALKSQFLAFRKAINDGLRQLQVTSPCYALKADGGTMPYDVAEELPCESVHSGPSASVMGCLALHPDNGSDAVLVDIGGTTTDIALLADGVPLLEPYGITVSGRPTLIRALNTRSVGLGGDSSVSCREGSFKIGPERQGPPMALGGELPTPTDAMIVLGRLALGSMAKAQEAMAQLIKEQEPETTAAQLLREFTLQLKKEVEQMIDVVFSRPVFTVSALLERKRLEPMELIAVGGPAKAMQDSLTEIFELPCTVPEHFEVANAIGAARTRPTLQATLYADTTDGSLTIPEIGCREKISSSYTMAEAEEKLSQVIMTMARESGLKNLPEIDFIERQEMNSISGFRTTGKIMTLKAQVQPGLL